MQVLKAMEGSSVQAGMASKPGKRLTKKTPQPEEGSTQKEPSQPSQPAKATAPAEEEKENQRSSWHMLWEVKLWKHELDG